MQYHRTFLRGSGEVQRLANVYANGFPTLLNLDPATMEQMKTMSGKDYRAEFQNKATQCTQAIQSQTAWSDQDIESFTNTVERIAFKDLFNDDQFGHLVKQSGTGIDPTQAMGMHLWMTGCMRA